MRRYKPKGENLALSALATIAFLCLTLLLCGCTGESETQEEKQFDKYGLHVSDAFSYEELKSYYSENYDFSLNDAEGKLAQMEITADDEGTYRVATQKDDVDGGYTLFIEFYLETAESEESFAIRKIKNAMVSVRMNQDEHVLLGDITCWLREKNQIEYSLSGDIYQSLDVKESNSRLNDRDNENILSQTYSSSDVNLYDVLQTGKRTTIYVHNTIAL